MMNLFDSNKLMNRMFRKVDNVVWDMMTGKIGVKVADGIASLELDTTTGDAGVTINGFDQASMSLPAFAQNTPLPVVQVGDVILKSSNNDRPSWVVGIKTSQPQDGSQPQILSFDLLSIDGTRSNWKPPKVQMLGFGDNGVMVLRTLTSMLPGNGLSQLQGDLSQMAMLGMLQDDNDLSEFMMLALMSGQNGQQQQGGGLFGGGIMGMLMMKKLMSKDGGGGLFGNSSGSSKKRPAASDDDDDFFRNRR